jgi:hypothetical protein
LSSPVIALEVVGAGLRLNLGVIVAVGDAPRRTDERADGLRQPVGEPDAEPDRRQQEDEGEAKIKQPEGQLHPGPLVHQAIVFELLLARLGELFDDGGVHQPVDIQKPVVKVLQPHETADHVAVAWADQHEFALLGLLQRLLFWRPEGDRAVGGRGGFHPALGRIDHEHARQASEGSVRCEPADEGVAVGVEQLALLGEILGDEGDVAARHFRLLADIGFGHAFSAADDVAGAFGEPCVEAAVERHRGEQGDNQRRHGCEQRQHRDDLDVQTSPRLLAPARLDQGADLPADQRRHQRHQRGVGDEEGDHHLARRADRREPGEHEERGDAGDHRHHHHGEAEAVGVAGKGQGGRIDPTGRAFSQERHVDIFATDRG